MHTNGYIFLPNTFVLSVVKVKLSRNKSWGLRRGINVGLASLLLTFSTARTAELSALSTGGTLPPRKFLGTHFCYSLRGPQGY